MIQECNKYKIINGDCLEEIKKLPDKSVYCCVTSPPYYDLRDYKTGEWVGGNPDCNHEGNKQSFRAGKKRSFSDATCIHCGAIMTDKQIGRESTPDEYISNLVKIFKEVKRVLKDDGTLWIIIGDSYATKNEGVYKPKDLIGIPWLLAFALRADGWYLRQDIVWRKTNAMPESVKDRCTKSHEYVFLLTKSSKYYFNSEAMKEDATSGRAIPGIVKNRLFKLNSKINKNPDDYLTTDNIRSSDYKYLELDKKNTKLKRNKRDVWSVAASHSKSDHIAIFPEELIRPCILAGCPDGETVLDPFSGSGTTGIVALKNKKRFIGIELSKRYYDDSCKLLESVLEK